MTNFEGEHEDEETTLSTSRFTSRWKNRVPSEYSGPILDSEMPDSSKSSNTNEVQGHRRNKLQLPTLARICDQYLLSDRSAAAISSAVLQDVGKFRKCC